MTNKKEKYCWNCGGKVESKEWHGLCFYCDKVLRTAQYRDPIGEQITEITEERNYYSNECEKLQDENSLLKDKLIASYENAFALIDKKNMAMALLNKINDFIDENKEDKYGFGDKHFYVIQEQYFDTFKNEIKKELKDAKD